MKKQTGDPVFSSVELSSEFYSSPDVEGEASPLTTQYDYTPIIPGTVRGTLLVGGKNIEIRDDGKGGLMQRVPRSFLQWILRKPALYAPCGVVRYDTGEVVFGIIFVSNYQYDTGGGK